MFNYKCVDKCILFFVELNCYFKEYNKFLIRKGLFLGKFNLCSFL